MCSEEGRKKRAEINTCVVRKGGKKRAEVILHVQLGRKEERKRVK